jgi:hypothetical protein
MNRIQSIQVAPTTEKKTQPGRFEVALRGAAEGAARGVVGAVELAAPYVPGGTILAAAVRTAASGGGLRAGSASGIAGSSLSAEGAGTVSEGGSSEGDLLAATRTLQQEARTFNLQYLQLQEQMQRESREFTAVSNVMKVKHDSAKSAINNIH